MTHDLATQPRWERSAAMVEEEPGVNIAVCPCLQFISHTQQKRHPIENKVWEIYFFIKKCVRSFIKVRILCLIMCNIFICMRKHSQHNNEERTQFLRKIYLSHFIQNGTKGLRKGYVWEVSWRLNKDCNILTPSSSSYSSTSFSSCGLLKRVWFSLLRTETTDSKLQTNWTSCHTGLYHCLTSTCFLWASHLHRIQRSRLYSDIFDQMHLFLDWRIGQYVTYVSAYICIMYVAIQH